MSMMIANLHAFRVSATTVTVGCADTAALDLGSFGKPTGRHITECYANAIGSSKTGTALMKYNKEIVCAWFEQFGLPRPEPEFKFHPTRKWRFDFAWPDVKVALEVDGGIWVQGRHNRGAAMKAQWEKENEAAAMGWRILKCEPRDVCLATTADLVLKCRL